MRRASARNVGRKTMRCSSTGSEQPLDVLGHDVRDGVEQRPRARGALEREAAAHGAPTATSSRSRVAARARRSSAAESVVDVHRRHGLAHRVHVLDEITRLQPAQRMAVALLVDDLQLLVGRRVAERGLEEEAVELRLRQRERALVLDRVLGREQQERIGQPRVVPSTVTCCSAIASSSADCVFGIARLISSTSTTFAKIGPGRNSKSRSRWL
jgi:hypothetical protein